MMDHVQRAILENQVILAEALWMLIHKQGSTGGALDHVSARIAATRKLLEDDEGRKKYEKHTRKRLVDIELIQAIKHALDTAENGEALVEVARNAHLAELELAREHARRH